MRANFELFEMAPRSQIMGVVIIICFLMCPSILLSQKVYVVVPSSDFPCPEDPCLTLSQFADNLTSYVDANNTTLIFEAGNHRLDSEISIKLPSLNSLSMIANARLSTPSVATIICSKYARFVFSHVQTVKVSGLNFVGCAGNKIELVDHFVAEDSSFTGQQEMINTALEIEDTYAEIVRTSFKHNSGMLSRQRRQRVGGAIVCTRSNLSISKCLFENNTANSGGAIYREHELALIHNSFIITIINSTFIGNQALPYNGQYALYSGCNGGAISAFNADIFISGSTFINNTASNDGGAFALYNYLIYGLYQVTINNSEFTNNIARQGGALWWNSRRTDIEINACKFGNNSAHRGGVVYIDGQTEGRAVLSNNQFIANNAIKGGVVMASPGPYNIVYYGHETINTITITKSIFESNIGKHDGGVFYLQDTHISLTDSSFIRNQANGSEDTVRYGHGGVFYTYDKTVLNIARATLILLKTLLRLEEFIWLSSLQTSAI